MMLQRCDMFNFAWNF